MAVTEGMNNAWRTFTLFLKHHGHPGICLSRKDLTFGGDHTEGAPRRGGVCMPRQLGEEIQEDWAKAEGICWVQDIWAQNRTAFLGVRKAWLDNPGSSRLDPQSPCPRITEHGTNTQRALDYTQIPRQCLLSLEPFWCCCGMQPRPKDESKITFSERCFVGAEQMRGAS